MNIELYEQLWVEFEDQEYRHAYVDSLVDSTIAIQLKLLREQNNLTQAQLAALASMRQSRISAMEDVNYSSWSVTTLKRLASAFDCGLEVRFVPFNQVIRWGASMTPDALRVQRFNEDANAHKSRKNDAAKIVDINTGRAAVSIFGTTSSPFRVAKAPGVIAPSAPFVNTARQFAYR
jgi:predicted XRE-type DNA-binding protein